MNLTPLQLEIQQRADKTLSFGCLFWHTGLDYYKGQKILCKIVGYSDRTKGAGGQDQFSGLKNVRFLRAHSIQVEYDYNSTKEPFEIIGHPMNWGRLEYLYRSKGTDTKILLAFTELARGFNYQDRTNYQQTVLERPIKLQELVLSFLKTLGPL